MFGDSSVLSPRGVFWQVEIQGTTTMWSDWVARENCSKKKEMCHYIKSFKWHMSQPLVLRCFPITRLEENVNTNIMKIMRIN